MSRIPKKPLPQFSFWCRSCEFWVNLVYKNRPESDGMTGAVRNKRRMVLECEGCGCVHAERKPLAAAAPRPKPKACDCGGFSCVKCIMAKRKRLGVQKGQCTDCKGTLPHGEEIGMCRPCATATWGDK